MPGVTRSRLPQCGTQSGATPNYFGPFVDKLELNLYGTLKSELISDLMAVHEELRASDSSHTFFSIASLPGGDLCIHASAPTDAFSNVRAYALCFRNELFAGGVTAWSNMPEMRVRFLNHVLYGHTLDELDWMSREIARCFFAGQARVQVGAFDYALDVQDPGFTVPVKDEVVTMKSRLIREMDDPQSGGERSITIGKHGLAYHVQIYNKTNEILTNGKDYIRESYRQTGKFREDEPVFRTELRFTRDYLRDFRQETNGPGIETIQDVNKSLGDLVVSVLGDEEAGIPPKVRLVDPESATRRSRQTTTTAWSGIVHAFSKGHLSRAV